MKTARSFLRRRIGLAGVMLIVASSASAEIVLKGGTPMAQDTPQEPPEAPLTTPNRKIARIVAKAEAGDVAAMLQLGWIYYEGRDVPQNFREAYRRFRAAADRGDFKAMLAAGYLLAKGIGVARDRSSARTLLNLAVNAGYPRALYLLSLLEGDIGSPQSVSTSRQLLERAATLGDTVAANALGTFYERAGQPATAKLWYAQAAAAGSKSALANAGRLDEALQESEAQTQHIKELKQQVTAGNADAAYELATRFHVGNGVPVNYGEALRYYRLAAGMGHEQAKRMTSLILSRSNGGQQINATWMQELVHLALDQRSSTGEMSATSASISEDPLAGLLDFVSEKNLPVEMEATIF